MIDTTQYVIKQIEERDIRFLRLWFTDLLGGLKNVAITPSDVESAFEEGVGFAGDVGDGSRRRGRRPERRGIAGDPGEAPDDDARGGAARYTGR